MGTIFKKQFEAAVQEAQRDFCLSRKDAATLAKAADSKYYMVSAMAAHWHQANDSALPDTRLQALLLEAHKVPVSRADLREHPNDYGPEMRWLVDAMLSEWVADPREMATINQSHLRETLNYLARHNNNYTCIPILEFNEAGKLHRLALDLRSKNPAAVGEEISALCQARQEELRLAITNTMWASLQPHREYFLGYFGLNAYD